MATKKKVGPLSASELLKLSRLRKKNLGGLSEDELIKKARLENRIRGAEARAAEDSQSVPPEPSFPESLRESIRGWWGRTYEDGDGPTPDPELAAIGACIDIFEAIPVGEGGGRGRVAEYLWRRYSVGRP